MANPKPMRQWDVRVPPTMQLGSYRFGPVRKTMAEAKRAALSEYNDSRRHEGLPTLKSLPRGTTVKEYEVWPKRTNQRTVNPRTLVPAKLKMMPNGTIKVLVSPGAMAKMRVGI